jgi:hypothetical protein
MDKTFNYRAINVFLLILNLDFNKFFQLNTELSHG